MAQGGKPFYDRKLAGDVRTKALEDVLALLNEEEQTKNWSKMKVDMLLKLSTNLLPRLNEHTGADGEKLTLVFDNDFTRKTETDSKK